MTVVHFPHSANAYALMLETQESLLACLSLILLALGCYLLWPGVARCCRQLRIGADWLARPAAARGMRPRRITLQSGGHGARSPLSALAWQCKLRWRALLHARSTARWLAFWNRSRTHRALAVASPRLLHKIYRPYHSLRLGHRQRLELLLTHYEFVVERGLAPLVLRAARQPLRIARITGKSGQAYELRLAAIGSLDQEGELALHLYRDQRQLFSTAFTVCRQCDDWVIRLGCLQGASGADSREQIRRATRDLCGLRPKALMLRLVRAIGNGVGCQRVVLVSNANRVASRRHKRHQVHADYDGFWQELGAARRRDGDYELPCSEPETRIEDLPSRKRAEARQRLALVRQATQEVAQLFSLRHG